MHIPITNLPEKYEALWRRALPILQKGRPGDDIHAKETVEFVLEHKSGLKFDFDIIIPVAMMHDIGHAALLPEHIPLVTGPQKLPNSKLVHMLAGAKIAKELLEKVDYNKQKSAEIVDIISMHDGEQLKGMGREVYTTDHKRIFHDIDMLDRFNEGRLKRMKSLYPDREQVRQLLEPMLEDFFYIEFKKIANLRYKKMFST